VNVGSEDLSPEKSWSGELGLDLGTSSGLGLSLTGFLRSSKDLIDWARETDAPPDSPWETRNVKSATFRGFEADLSFMGPLETSWTLGGMILSVDSDETSGFISKYALRPLTEQINLGVGRVFDGGLSLGVKGQRGKRDGEDPYTRLDLRSGIRIGGTRLYMDLHNLFDERYPDITGALAPGRAFYLGVEVGTRRGARD
jgi:outer membrane cobalamin receptor